MDKTTFIDILKSDNIRFIEIPKIQRDYAHGRQDIATKRIRKRFLDALYKAITDTPVVLDFIYGDVEDGKFIPLDGQQRLTTLFLLHWYAAVHDSIKTDDYKFLKHFSYDTRYCSRTFCEELVSFIPLFPCDEKNGLSKQIINQSWFSISWKKDPTVSSMLIMLDDINQKFFEVQDLWKKLENGAISFYCMAIKDMGITDDIYVKMNSRGKPLTRFEHFKAELEKQLRFFDEESANRISRKIDGEWTDLLWKCFHQNNEYAEGSIDKAFLMYFNFIADVICYKRNETAYNRSRDEFDLLEMYFTIDSEEESRLRVKESIVILESFFDCWCSLTGSPSEFDSMFFSSHHEKSKTKLQRIDLFNNCLVGYLNDNGERAFSFGDFILFYGICFYLCNKDRISEIDFRRRIRIVNNLVMNSEDELSDNPNRQGGNRIPEILKETDSILLNGIVPEPSNPGFNSYQLIEERKKLEWTENNPDKAEELYKLEDHNLIYGQISVIGIDNECLFEKFSLLFDKCDWDLVTKALMTIGPCLRKERNGWRYQLGSSGIDSAWRNLFHQSSAEWIENVSSCLVGLLRKLDKVNDSELSVIVEEYIKEAEHRHIYDWRYYFIKYDKFRPGSYGKYYWDDYDNKPYEMIVMKTPTNVSPSSYHPYLLEMLANQEYYQGDFDWSAKCKGVEISCNNDDINIDGKIYRIQKNEDGTDAENRIEVGRMLISSFHSQDVK